MSGMRSVREPRHCCPRPLPTFLIFLLVHLLAEITSDSVCVSESLCCKLSNFTQARIIVQEDAMSGDSWAPPVRWAAPEVYSRPHPLMFASDIWSLAVVLHEIFSADGQKPFYAIPDDDRVRAYVVQNKRRLEQPPKTPVEMYNLMLQCWQFVRRKAFG